MVISYKNATPVALLDTFQPRKSMIVCEGTTGGKVCEQMFITFVGNV